MFTHIASCAKIAPKVNGDFLIGSCFRTRPSAKMALEFLRSPIKPSSMYLDWLREGLKKKGKTQQGLADAMGVDRTVVTKMVSGQRPIRVDELTVIATYIDELVPNGSGTALSPILLVPITSVADGNVWRNAGSPFMYQSVAVPAVPDLRVRNLTQHAVRVEGTDFNKTFQFGDYPIFVPFWDMRKVPHDGDIVELENKQGALTQTLVRRVRVNHGVYEFWPESTDPSWQNPIVVKDIHNLDGLEIVGLYVGLYRAANI